MLFQPNKIIFHHTADHYDGKQFNRVNEYHGSADFLLRGDLEKYRKSPAALEAVRKIAKSKLGYFCGYHLFIECDGSVIVARSLDEVGAHTLGENWEAYGICMAGNFNFEQPTAAQKESLGKWCGILMKRSNISINRIFPHRAFRPTDCPGDNLPDKYAAAVAIEQELSIIKKAFQWLKITLQK